MLSRLSEDCTLGSLAEEFGVSERTIRNDVKSLNGFLKETSLGEVHFGPGGVIVLPDDFQRAEGLLPVRDNVAYKMSSDERKSLGAAILIGANFYVTLADIAERFSVSRASILNDLDGIKQIVSSAGLKVESKPSRGLRVSGPESLRRRFLVNFLDVRSPIVEQWLHFPENSSIRDDSIIVKKILNEQCHAYGLFMPDATFLKATNSLCISVMRNRAAKFLEDPAENNGESNRPSDVGDFERGVISYVSQYCNVEMGESEERYFSALLKALRFHGDQQFNLDNLQVQKITRVFIRCISEEISVDLNGDYDLFEYLSNHLESMFTTEPSHFPENPVLREVVEDQPIILAAVKKHLDILEEFAGREISPIETMYIALHICAALERRKNRGVRPRVVVVCDGGVGTSQLLAEELRGRFEIKIVKVMPAHDVPYIDAYRTDLVISTVPLDNCPVDSVLIKLPMNDREYRRVRERLNRIVASSDRVLDDRPEDFTAQGLLEHLEPVIRRLAPDNDDLLKEIRLEVRRYFREAQQLEDQIIAPYLHQLLPPSHIRLDVEVSDWREAIRASAQPLLKMGYIEERYVDAMIEDVEKYGPYMALSPGVAIPHSSPENGTIKMGMSMVRLANPISFGSESNDPVEFVFTLSAVDRKTHLRAFANLIDMVSKPDIEFLAKLKTAKSEEEASRIIENCEFQLVS
jgi:transcriptional antiterminator/mannitol/fructose-specific phosphotransferase system IIA component (Ntr-type)